MKTASLIMFGVLLLVGQSLRGVGVGIQKVGEGVEAVGKSLEGIDNSTIIVAAAKGTRKVAVVTAREAVRIVK
jgi:hypothetical protein